MLEAMSSRWSLLQSASPLRGVWRNAPSCSPLRSMWPSVTSRESSDVEPPLSPKLPAALSAARFGRVLAPSRSLAEAVPPEHRGEWPPHHPCLHALAWGVLLTFVGCGLGVLTLWMLVTARHEMAAGGHTAPAYAAIKGWLYARSVLLMLLVQEPIKVLAITLISPQVMPSVRAVRAPTCRVRAQLCLRGALTALYTVVSMLF
jgi:hypothetical protein